jgi:multidrug efflux pump subunit AcrA (membrane-fusion protein)
LAADQAAIDLDQVNVQIAQQNLAAATLTSPLAGTVAAVNLTAGSSVSADSSTAVISVLAPGSYLVSATVPLSGTVAAIGVLKSSSSTSTATSFPITVAVQSSGATLYDGSGAAVTISVGKVDGVLTVPSSAVHTDGSRSTVTVLNGASQQTVSVTTGVVGQDLTEITSGLNAGQTVVLADLTAAIPTSTAATRPGTGFGVGGGAAGVGTGAGGARGFGGGAGGGARTGG